MALGVLFIVIGIILILTGMLLRAFDKRNGTVRLKNGVIEVEWENEPDMVNRILREKDESIG